MMWQENLVYLIDVLLHWLNDFLASDSYLVQHSCDYSIFLDLTALTHTNAILNLNAIASKYVKRDEKSN